MRAVPQREQHLQEATEHGAELAAQLFEAEARLDAKDATAALVAINRAKEIAPQHTALLRLELKARQLTGQWDEVDRLLDALMRGNALEPGIAAQNRRMAYAENLKRRAEDDRGLLEYWKKIPAEFKTDPWVARAAARAFMQRGGDDTALDVLEAALNREWHEDLVALYGELRGSNPARQIEQAEKWLQARPRDAQLLLSAGAAVQRAAAVGQGAKLSGGQPGDRRQRRRPYPHGRAQDPERPARRGLPALSEGAGPVPRRGVIGASDTRLAHLCGVRATGSVYY
jgi:HemY protein